MIHQTEPESEQKKVEIYTERDKTFGKEHNNNIASINNNNNNNECNSKKSLKSLLYDKEKKLPLKKRRFQTNCQTTNLSKCIDYVPPKQNQQNLTSQFTNSEWSPQFFEQLFSSFLNLVHQTTDQSRKSESQMIGTWQLVNSKSNFALLTTQQSHLQNATQKSEVQEHENTNSNIDHNQTRSTVPLSSKPPFSSLSQSSIYGSEIFHFLTVMKKLFEFAQKFDPESDSCSQTLSLSLTSSWILVPQTMNSCK